jgi:carboxymethylenebutenolidase
VGSSTVEIPTADGVADAYLTQPDDDARNPGVLFIMDAYGLRPQIEQMTDRIASHGYTVLAPNVFYRSGRAPVLPVPDLSDPEARSAFFASVKPLMAELTPDALDRDGRAYLDYLAEVAAPGPVAIAGYCMGGRVGWRIAAAHPDRVAALGSFHAGGLVTDAPDSPHLSADRLRGEVYFGHADNDQSMPPEAVAGLERALDAAGVSYRSELYEGARHGYTMADTPVYDEAAAERHYAELLALLGRTLAPA